MAALLGGCSDSEGGTPEGNSPASSAVSATTEQQSDTTNDASALAELDPCSILNTEDIAQFGPVEDPAPKEVGGERTCNWEADRTDTAADMPSTGVAIRETGGVDVMNDLGQGVQHVEENGREYGRTPGPGGCVIGIAVTDTSRVDVQVTGVEADKACEIANALVEKAEPNVPRG